MRAGDERAGSARVGSRVEIQIHPSDIRKRVRYLFLSRRQIVAGSAGLLAYLGLLILAGLLAPQVLTGLLNRHEYESLTAERERRGERLQELVERLAAIEERGETLHLRLAKIFLAYGISTDESIGQGGYPFKAPPVPSSKYANVIESGNKLASRIREQNRVLETFLAEVGQFEQAHREQVRTTPSVCPLSEGDFVLTSPFGNRRSPFTKQLDFHAGIDLAAARGTRIRAPADGVVTFAGRYPLKRSVAWWRYGNLVVLRNGDGFVTLFGHCDQVLVRRGQRVRQGEVIATVGNTGWSTSPHLHYEVRRREEDGTLTPVDPRIYILDRRWRNEERLLIRARQAPAFKDFEPLPSLFAR